MIYCVEDDSNIRDLMLYALQAAGFEAAGFEESGPFWEALKESLPDLILLDIMLPEEDGLSILKKLRSAQATAEIPVIMATAKGSEYDKVIGLDLGADDYLVKPFGMLEMVARIKAVLRRTSPVTQSAVLTAGPISLDPAKHTVLADGSPDALRVAKENIRRCGLGARAVTIEADALAPPPPRLGSFDLITCNPPYIPTAEIAALDASVRDHEPRLALDGGEDGLKFYRAVLGGWKSLLRQSGWLLFEVGETQAEDVEKLMRLAGLRALGRAKDSGGYDRVVYGRL